MEILSVNKKTTQQDLQETRPLSQKKNKNHGKSIQRKDGEKDKTEVDEGDGQVKGVSLSII